MTADNPSAPHGELPGASTEPAESIDEDHIVVDCEGRIIVQTRQLAMVPAQ